MEYQLGDYKFDVRAFFPDTLFEKITQVRLGNPAIVLKEAQTRRRRKSLTKKDGKLTILAADHPGRYITQSGDDPILMGNRQSYLGRVLRVVTDPQVDGVMGTPDIIEDLFIVNYLVKDAGGQDFLDRKVLLGSMNRGGLAGTVFEMDDTFTAYTPQKIVEYGLDGGKLVFRIEPKSPDSGRTLLASAQAVTECANLGIPCFVEPLPVQKVGGAYQTKKTKEDLIKIIGVASAIGATSLYTWLKIPYCEGYEEVVRATTLPCLMLGGESRETPIPIIEEFAAGMKAGSNVRGALVGRNVHHPGDDDPLAVALAINGIVHQGFTVEDALGCLTQTRGKNMSILADLFA